MFFLAASLSFANEKGESEISKDKTTIVSSRTDTETTSLIVDECSVTSSGTVEMAGGGSFTATLTVTGPCDSSLAQKMRDAIQALRDSFK